MCTDHDGDGAPPWDGPADFCLQIREIYSTGDLQHCTGATVPTDGGKDSNTDRTGEMLL